MLYYTFMTWCWLITPAADCVTSIWQGAFWGLMVGLVVGIIRMVLEFSYHAPSCGQKNPQPAIVADVHYLYFAIILFAITSVIIIVVSLATAPISEQNVSMKHSFINGNNKRPFSRSHERFYRSLVKSVHYWLISQDNVLQNKSHISWISTKYICRCYL